MAVENKHSAGPRLMVVRSKAEEKLREQIKKGHEIIATVMSHGTPNLAFFVWARAEGKKWSDYNKELLKRLFDKRSIAEEYMLVEIMESATDSGQSDPCPRLRKLITKLESIVKRLDLIPELSEAPSSKEATRGKHEEGKTRWYQSRTIQAALITVAALLLIAVVGWYLDLYVNQPQDKSVHIQEEILEESKKQTNLLAEMKRIDETDSEELLKRYPLGYILFAIAHPTVVISYESRLKKECIIDLAKASITGLNQESIQIEIPSIECEGGPIFYRCKWGIRREIGKPTPVFGHFHNMQMYMELLVDDGKDLICLLGFKEAKKTKDK